MRSRKQYSISNKWKEIIKRNKRIHKFLLIEQLGISISYYEKLKPWMEFKFPDFISYDRETKDWVWVEEEKSDHENQLL